MRGVDDLLQRELAFADVAAPGAEQFETGHSGDAAEDRALQRRGDDLAVDLEEHVHRADFFHIFSLNAVQPQNLSVAELVGVVLRLEGSGIVAARLGEAHAALDRADVVALHVDLHGVDALFVVGADGGHDDDEHQVMRRMHAHVGIHGDDEGTDVKRGVFAFGDPVLVDGNELFDGADHEFLVKQRDAQALIGHVQTGHVLFGAEQNGFAGRLGMIGLHAFKHFLRIVQAHGGGLQCDRAVGHDAGVDPALALIVVHDEHMVGKVVAEPERRRIGLRFLFGGEGDFDLLHGLISPFIKYSL